MSIISTFVEPIRRVASGNYRLVRAEEIIPRADVQSITVFDEGNRGQALKGVMTEEYWLNPPYGRPRNIDYNELQQFEKSVWVQICIDAKVDAITSAEWDIVPRKKLERGEVGNEKAINDMRMFFENLPSEESFSVCLAEMIPDLEWYDAGVILKVFGLKDFDGETGKLKKGANDVIDLSVRDGRSFMIESSSIGGRWKRFWQYSWLNPSGIPTEFSVDEVMYFRTRPNSRGMYGTSRLEIVKDIVNYLMDSTEANSKLWENGLFIGGQIDHPDIKDVNELRLKAAEYKKNLQGPKKAGRWLVTGGGVKVQGFPFNPQQMQWLDGQKWFAKLVLSIFKIAPSEIGWTEDLNRATGMQQMNIHKSRAIRPLLKLIEDVINRDLVWKKYPDVSFKFKTSLDLEDKMKQAQIDEIYIRSGKVAINELRERDGEHILDDKKFDMPFAEGSGGGGQEGQEDDMFGDWNPFGDTGDTTEDEDDGGFVEKGGVGSGVKGHTTISLEDAWKMRAKYAYPGDMSQKRTDEAMSRIESGMKNGRFDPIPVTEEELKSGVLSEGKHRLIIARKLGIKNIPIEIRKAVNVGAVSGEAGFAMAPDVVDGHVMTKKIEDDGEKKLKEYWERVQKELENNLKEMYPDIAKGGVGEEMTIKDKNKDDDIVKLNNFIESMIGE